MLKLSEKNECLKVKALTAYISKDVDSNLSLKRKDCTFSKFSVSTNNLEVEGIEKYLEL